MVFDRRSVSRIIESGTEIGAMSWKLLPPQQITGKFDKGFHILQMLARGHTLRASLSMYISVYISTQIVVRTPEFCFTFSFFIVWAPNVTTTVQSMLKGCFTLVYSPYIGRTR